MGTQGTGNMGRAEAESIFEKIADVLDTFDEVLEVIPCGSYRRGKEFVNVLHA